MEILKENQLYTNSDMAEWFGITENTFKVAKKKKLEILKHYAEFEERKGKIYITKVLEPKYIKKSKREENNKKYQQMCIVVVQKDRLQTYVSITTDLWLTQQEVLKAMGHESFSTAYDYVRNNMKMLFMEHDGEQPLYGKCLGYRWCKKFTTDEGFIYYIEMTDEEKDFWFKLRDQFYATYKKYDWKTIQKISEGEISIEEVERQQGKLYVDSLFENWNTFEERYGGRPSRVRLYALPEDGNLEGMELIK